MPTVIDNTISIIRGKVMFKTSQISASLILVVILHQSGNTGI